jgi:hypothetical protein
VTPEQAWQFYVVARDRLFAMQDEISGSATTIAEGHVLFGRTEEEALSLLEWLRNECDRQVVMFLVAAIESVVMSDANQRRKDKSPNETTKQLRYLFEQDERVVLEDVLDAWKLTIGGPAIGEFKQTLPFRHWLAHGRHWHYRGPLTIVPPELVRDRGNKLLSALGLTMQLDS